jgi:hypothetical protein
MCIDFVTRPVVTYFLTPYVAPSSNRLATSLLIGTANIVYSVATPYIAKWIKIVPDEGNDLKISKFGLLYTTTKFASYLTLTYLAQRISAQIPPFMIILGLSYTGHTLSQCLISALEIALYTPPEKAPSSEVQPTRQLVVLDDDDNVDKVNSDGEDLEKENLSGSGSDDDTGIFNDAKKKVSSLEKRVTILENIADNTSNLPFDPLATSDDDDNVDKVNSDGEDLEKENLSGSGSDDDTGILNDAKKEVSSLKKMVTILENIADNTSNLPFDPLVASDSDSDFSGGAGSPDDSDENL